MSFKDITTEDVRHIQSIIPPERVFVGDEIHEDFWHDEMPEYGHFAPAVLVQAQTALEVSAILKYASSQNIPVTPRGAGTGLCGGCVAIHGGILLSLAGMNKILDVNKDAMSVTVESGVLLSQLAECLQEHNLLYPPDPGEKTATIGGTSMTNAGGMRAVAFGVTRDYIKGLEVVLPNGEIIMLGGDTVKNSSGYNLMHLMIGSEGTLGVVTKLILKVLPLPNRFVSLLVPFDDIDQCARCVPLLLQTSPATLEYTEREVLLEAEQYLGKAFPHSTAAAYLIVSFYGNSRKAMEPTFDMATEICMEHGALDVFISDTAERQEAMWSARGAFLEAIKSSTSAMDECDVVLRIDKVAPFIEFTKGLATKYQVRIRSFGHAGDGNLHIYVCKDSLSDEAWKFAVTSVMDALYTEAAKMGGKVSGEHGIGHAKRKYLLESLGSLQMDIMGKIKQAFDPSGILNPGKILI